MGGVVGLNLQACLSKPSAEDSADPEELEYLLTSIEAGALPAMAAKLESEVSKAKK